MQRVWTLENQETIYRRIGSAKAQATIQSKYGRNKGVKPKVIEYFLVPSNLVSQDDKCEKCELVFARKEYCSSCHRQGQLSGDIAHGT